MRMHTVTSDYGTVHLGLTDRAALAPYIPIVSNTVNLIALHIEHLRLTDRLRELNRTLDDRVHEQTVALEQHADRLRRQNQILHALHRVGSLVSSEQSHEKLLAQAVEYLVRDYGYHYAWVGLLGEDGTPSECFHAGLGPQMDALWADIQQKNYPACVDYALSHRDISVALDVNALCPSCPIRNTYGGHANLTKRIEHGELTLGWLSVSVPAIYASDPSEQDLFAELCRELGQGLWALRVEAARQASELRYGDIIAHMSDALISFDTGGTITLLSPAAEKLLGCPTAQAIHTTIMRFCPADREQQWQAVFDRFWADKKPVMFETECRSTAGTRISVEVALSAHRNPLGETMGLNAMVRDITERKQAEEDLLASESQFHGVFDSSPAGIALIDVRTMRFVDANASFLDIIGYTLSELQTRTIADISHPDDVERETTLLHDLGAGRIPKYSLDKRYIRKDGQVRWVNLAGDLLDTFSLGVPLAIANVIDITERRHTQDELQRQQRIISLNNRVAQAFLTSEGDDLYKNVLDVLLDAFGSPYGLFGYIDSQGRSGMPIFDRRDDESVPHPWPRHRLPEEHMGRDMGTRHARSADQSTQSGTSTSRRPCRASVCVGYTYCTP